MKADDGEETSVDGGRRSRLELSLPQVAGSAVAAVVAAKLASSFGVYGTILGAGVVSVIATCGGTVLQHFLKRTGEQLRDVRGVTAHSARTGPAPQPGRVTGEFGAATLHRAGVRGWRRPVLAAAVVFGVTMAGITTYELVTGSGLGGGSSPTVADALSGHSRPSTSDDPGSSDSSDPAGPTDPADPSVSSGPSGDADSPEGDASSATTPSATSSGGPADSASEGSGEDAGSGTGQEATPGTGESSDGGGESGAAPAPSASATAPAPSASGRSGIGDPDPAGPEAP